MQLFLNQLVRVGKLKQFLHQPITQGEQPISRSQRGNVPWSSLGTINVIFAALDPSFVKGVMTISSQTKADEKGVPFKKFKLQDQPILGFSKVDKEGMIQPYDDALQITRFDVKKVMIN